MLFHSGKGAGNFNKTPPSVQYLGSFNQTTSASVNIGTASAKRSIVVVANGFHSSSTSGFSSITINSTEGLRIGSLNTSSYSAFSAIAALNIPTGTTASILVSMATYTGLSFDVYSIVNGIPITYAAATASGAPGTGGIAYSQILTTALPVKKSIIFSGISVYASGATNATSTLGTTYINSYTYIFGSGYNNLTETNPYTVTWNAPPGNPFSSLGKVATSLAIGF